MLLKLNLQVGGGSDAQESAHQAQLGLCSLWEEEGVDCGPMPGSQKPHQHWFWNHRPEGAGQLPKIAGSFMWTHQMMIQLFIICPGSCRLGISPGCLDPIINRETPILVMPTLLVEHIPSQPECQGQKYHKENKTGEDG